MSLEAPESTLPYPPLFKDKKFVVLSDWDGTITTYDSNDYLTDHLGYGKDKRREGNLDILSGKVTFRDAFREMLQSVVNNGHGYKECKEILRKNIVLDRGFKSFHTFCKAHDIPVIIVSSGMEPTIRAVLHNLLEDADAESIPIISNTVKYLGDDAGLENDDTCEGMNWTIQFRHPTSGFGHDKSQAILPYRGLENTKVIFFGDGVSDMSAAKWADWLFVKEKIQGENDLAAYCRNEKIPHRTFHNFEDVVPVVEKLVNGEDVVFGF